MLDERDINGRHNTQAESINPNSIGRQLVGLLARRRSVTPIHLAEPGPSPDEIKKLLTVATRVPDHGMLEPWRFILVEGTTREKLAAKLAAAYLQENPQQERAASDLLIRKIKAVLAPPLVVIVVSRADPSARIPEWEQVLSAGAVCMSLIAAATALGYSSTWLTGWMAYDPAALQILGVRSSEKVAGVIPIGTANEPQQDRNRPSLQKLVTIWAAI